MDGHVVFCEPVDERGEGHRLVQDKLVIGHQKGRNQHRGVFAAQLISDVAENRCLTLNVLDQVGPACVFGNDAIQVPDVERDAIVETGTGARDNSESDSRDCRVNAEDVRQGLVCVPPAVASSAEIGQACRIRESVVCATQYRRICEVLPYVVLC